MTWPDVAAAHVGHRAVLRDPATLRCVECDVTLLLPLRTDLAPTPTPGPWQPERDDLRPMPSGFKDRVLREIRARKVQT